MSDDSTLIRSEDWCACCGLAAATIEGECANCYQTVGDAVAETMQQRNRAEAAREKAEQQTRVLEGIAQRERDARTALAAEEAAHGLTVAEFDRVRGLLRDLVRSKWFGASANSTIDALVAARSYLDSLPAAKDAQ